MSGPSARAPGWSALRVCWYDLATRVAGAVLRLGFGLRMSGRANVPLSGPVIFVANHQSYLDPPILAVSARARPLAPMAREALFRFKPFGLLISSLGSIPLRDETGDAGAMRAALAELAAGRCVALYPEGSRSPDGEMRPFRRGFAVLVKRSQAPVVPMGMAGQFEAWPRQSALPRFGGRMVCVVGSPIPAATLLADEDSGVARLESVVRELARSARDQRRAALNSA